MLATREKALKNIEHLLEMANGDSELVRKALAEKLSINGAEKYITEALLNPKT